MKKRIYLSALVIIMVISSITACKKEEATVYFATETEQNAVADSVVSSKETDTESEITGEKGIAGKDATLETDTASQMCVYICGSVVNPGVYYMKNGTRICDLIELAGGMTDEACKNYWNLAEELYDGRMIYVPTAKEVEENLSPDMWKENGSSSAGNTNIGSTATDGKINLNTATKEQLMTLTGIGESKAVSIIKYRTENGSFSSIEDITNVSGIGEAMFNKIKDDITVN